MTISNINNANFTVIGQDGIARRFKRKSLDDTLAEIRRYNNKTDKHLTYGQYIAARDNGWL